MGGGSTNRVSTGTEAHDSHISRIASKVSNIFLHPGEQRLLVLQP